uniref:RTA1 like protein n=1 Tax=Mycena chlorophos TaxID=658473 RepID=A0ABQ0LHZ9_MYCCL|nr:predicted protein [Mycena chlorophos]
MSKSLLFLVLTALCAAAFAAETATNGEAIIGGYVPKKSLSFIALVLYGISALVMWIQFFVVTPRRKFILWLTCGMTAMAVGFALRILFSNDPTSEGKYIEMDLFILLSPCLFLANNYMILSHLGRVFPSEVVERSLIVRQSRIVKIFVWSDVTTFLLQSAGGSLTVSKNANTAKLGNTIGEIGIILQAVSYSLFTVVFLAFGSKIRKNFPDLWNIQTQKPFRVLSRQPIEDWRILFFTVCITCIGILIRSVFRIVEFVGGYHGRVQTHEGYFYVLDALPLWISMTLYCFVWPIRVFNRPQLTQSPSVMELAGKQYAGV